MLNKLKLLAIGALMTLSACQSGVEPNSMDRKDFTSSQIQTEVEAQRYYARFNLDLRVLKQMSFQEAKPLLEASGIDMNLFKNKESVGDFSIKTGKTRCNFNGCEYQTQFGTWRYYCAHWYAFWMTAVPRICVM